MKYHKFFRILVYTLFSISLVLLMKQIIIRKLYDKLDNINVTGFNAKQQNMINALITVEKDKEEINQFKYKVKENIKSANNQDFSNFSYLKKIVFERNQSSFELEKKKCLKDLKILEIMILKTFKTHVQGEISIENNINMAFIKAEKRILEAENDKILNFAKGILINGIIDIYRNIPNSFEIVTEITEFNELARLLGINIPNNSMLQNKVGNKNKPFLDQEYLFIIFLCMITIILCGYIYYIYFSNYHTKFLMINRDSCYFLMK